MATPKFPFIAYDNRLADAIPVASSTASGAAINLTDFRPYTNWKPATLPATITVDCGVEKSVDYLAMFNHDLFSNGCAVEVRGSTDNFVSSNVLVATLTPASDAPSILNFTSASYRYWRLAISGTTQPTLSIASLGVGLEFPTGLPYGSFDALSRKVFAQVNISVEGLPLGKAVMFEQWRQALRFSVVATAWIRSALIPAWTAHLRDKPFLFAHDMTNYPSEIRLVQTDGNFGAPSETAVYSTLSLSLKGLV